MEHAEQDAPGIFRRRETESGTGSSGSGFDSVASDIQVESKRRLVGSAIIYAAGWTFTFVISWARGAASGDPVLQPHTRDFIQFGLSLTLALVFSILVRSRQLPARRFLSIAVAFEILAALGINSDLWNWQHNREILRAIGAVELSGANAAGMRPVAYYGVPWTAVWLLVFPLIVPMPFRRALVATVATAATIPAILFGSQIVHGLPQNVKPYAGAYYLDLVLPTVICVALALYGCRVMYRLNRDLARARRLGSYVLTEKIGQGGMGEVWKARHQLLVRPAAVKLIRPAGIGLGDSETRSTLLRRFEREAQATAALQSPHTVEVFDFGVSQDGVFYYVMELLEGLTLRELVERFGPQSARRTVHILRAVCHSLADAHATGLIHRDVKPANIFVGRRGLDHDFVKVLDFGLVKEYGRRAANAQITQFGSTTGTPAFMAPEAALDAPNVDCRSDLYALGCVGYWLLTGQLVFDGPNAMAILLRAAQEPPVPPSRRAEIEIPAALDEAILSCLAKNPTDRPRNARELSRRLAAVEEQIGVWSPEEAERWWQLHQPQQREPLLASPTPHDPATVAN